MTSLKLISWNVNGIRACAKKGFSDFIGTASPDILSVQETKANEDQLTSVIRHPKGYFSYFSSAERKGYSGVATFTKTEPLSVERGFNIGEFDGEGRVLRLEYPDFYLFNIYFPNGGASPERLDYKMRFYDECLKQFKALMDAGKNVVVCGDVNTAHKEIDLARPKENSNVSGFLPIERRWIDDLIGSGFSDTLRMFDESPGRYTWWDMKSRARDRNVGWRLDYFFVSESMKENVKAAAVMPEIFGSDHCPISIEVEF